MSLFAGPAAALSVPAQQGPVDPEDVHAKIREILGRPEFREPGKSILQRIEDWVLRAIEKVFGFLGNGGVGSLVGWVLLVAAVGAAVVLFVRLFRGVGRDPVRTSARVTATRRRPAAAWFADADDLEQQGRYREALRCRYRGVVAELHVREVLDDVPGRTTGEERRELAARYPIAGPGFTEIADLFDQAWFGDAPTTEREVGRVRTLATDVLALTAIRATTTTDAATATATAATTAATTDTTTKPTATATVPVPPVGSSDDGDVS